MRKDSLPPLDGRYWASVLMASLLGTTLGDYVSQDLGLGYVRGLLPLGAVFAAILFAEHRAKRPSEGYYWAAVVMTRTAATNLADLATHALRLNYLGVGTCLGVLLAVALLIGRWRTANSGGPQEPRRGGAKTLPPVDARYWTAITIASTLGTTMGDGVSDGLKLGVGKGSLLLLAILSFCLCVQGRVRLPNEAKYWLMIVIVRTTGTVMGDYLSGEDGLKLGFRYAAASAALVLVGTLCLWRKRGRLSGGEQISD
jgi:uncharacterized membrane-anchored protein